MHASPREQLRPTLEALAAWGSRLPIDARIRPDTARAELILLGLAAAAPQELTDRRHEIYEFRVGDERFHVILDGGPVKLRSGPAQDPPAVVLTCDLPTLLRLAAGETDIESAVRDRQAAVTGSRRSAARVFKVLSFKNMTPSVGLESGGE